MICFDLVKKMRNVREWYNLTITEQALYYELVFMCNEKGWVDCFPCSNKRLALILNISERSLIRLRRRLVECGLVSFRSVKGKLVVVTYSLTVNLATGGKLPEGIELLLTKPDKIENDLPDNEMIRGAGDKASDRGSDKASDRGSDKGSDTESVLYKTKTKTKTNSDNERKIKEQFELFRKAYPGTKRGLDTEYKWFRQKHTDSETVTCLLLPAIEKQKRWRAQRKLLGLFVPEYPHLRTWLGQRRWEAELETHHTDSHESEPYIID